MKNKIILGLIFLLPVVFWPGMIGSEIFKLLFLMVTTLIALGMFLQESFTEKKIEKPKNWLTIAVPVFLLTAILATIFSVHPSTSFWGWPTNSAQGLVALLTLGVLFGVIIKLFNNSTRPVWALGSGVVLASIVSIWINGFINLTDAGVILALLVPFSLCFIEKWRRGWIIPAFLFALLLFFTVVSHSSFFVAWIVCFFGSSALLILHQKKNHKLFFSLSLVFLVTVSLFFSVAHFTGYGLSVNYQPQLSLVRESIQSKPLLGTGLALMDKVTRSSFNIVSSRGDSAVLDIVITMGILGLISFLFVCFSALKIALKSVKRQEVIALLMSLLLVMILHSFGLIIILFFFLVLALIAASDSQNKFSVSLQPFSTKALIASVLIFSLVITGCIGLFFVTRKVKAQYAYSQDNLAEAALLGNNDLYWREWSAYAFQKANEADQEEVAVEWLQESLAGLDLAEKLNPNESLNYQFRARIAQELKEDDIALENYNKAIAINCFHYLDLADFYLARFDSTQEEDYLNQAEEALNNLLALRPHHRPLVRQAGIHIRRQQIDEAVALLEEAFSLNSSPDILYQLGELYLNQDKPIKAQEAFQALVNNFPDDPLFLYRLGIVKAENGDKESALIYLRRLVEIEPDNKVFNNVLDNVENDRQPLAGMLDSVVE